MDAYLDLSYIFHLLILITVPYYFKKIMNKKMKLLELLSLGIVSLLLYLNIFVFENLPFINLLFLFVYFLLIYNRKSIKYYLLFLFVYYGNLATTMIFTNDIYLLGGMVMLNSPSAFLFIFIELVNIVVIEIILFSIRSIKLFKNYRKKIKIEIKGEYKEFLGYLDSGNTLIKDGFPVIFLNETYFIEDKYKEMLVNGIGSRKCKYFRTKVIINNKEKEVICASGNKNGFKGCECLINIHLMEENDDETIE